MKTYSVIWFLLAFSSYGFSYWYNFLWIGQQNTAYELSELSKQWRELCLKNIDIEAACVEIDGAIKQMKSEAAER